MSTLSLVDDDDGDEWERRALPNIVTRPVFPAEAVAPVDIRPDLCVCVCECDLGTRAR